MISDKGILYIEPSATTSPQPIIDELTRKMTAAYRQSTRGPAFRGSHTCGCGAHSDNCEHILPDGVETNSLCVHYLAYHRDEIPAAQLDKVRQLTYGEAEPKARELAAPGKAQSTRQDRPAMRGM
ncbi:MAG: hypothetical protein Q8Q33_08170 [Chlamydiota bacterium]|nr:hypothetical protein [Chlamydiota bacterium]